MDGGALPVQKLAEELRNHGGICAVGILPAAEDVKVAQADGRQAVVQGVLLGPLLIAALRERVGREQMALPALLFGKRRLVAVHGGAGGIDKLLHAVLPRGLHHIQRTLNVVGAVEKRQLDTAGHTAPRGLIEHIVHALTGGHAGIKILDVALNKRIVGLVCEQFNVRPLTRGQIVQTAHAIAQLQNRLAEVRADEARTAGDEKGGILWKFQVLIAHAHSLQ